MAHKNIQQLAALSRQELVIKADQLRRELFGLRLNALTSHIKDVSQFKKLRKDIARCLSLLTQKQNGEEQATVNTAHKE